MRSDDRSGNAVALLGGTFDPPHVGHLIVAQDVFEALPVERIVWLPCGDPPHKPPSSVTSPELRLEMTRVAVSGDERFDVSDMEIRRGGVSYTVDTLRELDRAASKEALFVVIGVDQLAQLGSWREPEEIARLSKIVVMTRSGDDPSGHKPSVDVAFDVVPVTRVDLSSTRIRDRVRARETLRYLVPDGVRAVIEREGLYT